MVRSVSDATISAYVLPSMLSCWSSTELAWSFTPPWFWPPFWSLLHANLDASKPFQSTHSLAGSDSTWRVLRMYWPLTGSTLVYAESMSYGASMVFHPPSGRYSKSPLTRWSGRFDVSSAVAATTPSAPPDALVVVPAVPVRPTPNVDAATRPARSLTRNPIPLILIN